MTSNKKPSRLPSKAQVFWAGAIGVGTLLVALLFQQMWGQPEQIACLIYGVLAAAFLAAQLFGFVLSQTEYSDEIESAKFRMLENEEAEWRDFVR